jgi:hypothetical protein
MPVTNDQAEGRVNPQVTMMAAHLAMASDFTHATMKGKAYTPGDYARGIVDRLQDAGVDVTLDQYCDASDLYQKVKQRGHAEHLLWSEAMAWCLFTQGVRVQL